MRPLPHRQVGATVSFKMLRHRATSGNAAAYPKCCRHLLDVVAQAFTQAPCNHRAMPTRAQTSRRAMDNLLEPRVVLVASVLVLVLALVMVLVQVLLLLLVVVVLPLLLLMLMLLPVLLRCCCSSCCSCCCCCC